jgi:hypothetical protein
MASPSPIRHMPKSTKATFVQEHVATYEVILNLTDAAHDRCAVTQASEPIYVRAAPYLGVRDCLCALLP